MFNQEQYGTESPGFQGVPALALFPRGLPVDRLETVYRYVAAGFPILPCEPQAKVPSLPRGFKDATTDIQPYDHPRLKGYAKVTLHHDKFKLISARNNLAIEPGRIGCTVVDIDPKNGGHKTWNALIAEHGPIATRKVRTPSGGWHLWFSGTISTVNRKLGPGIDTRCFGGYVLLPPSSVKGRRYEWVDETVPIASLPDWAREIAEAQTEGPATRRTRRGHPNGEGADATEDDAAALEEAFDTWKAAGGDGGRFEYLLSRIGDEESGGDGFADAMTRALGHAARAGMPLDEAVARIAGAARAAPPGNRTSPYIEEKIFQLRGAFKRFRAQDAAQEEEVRKVAEEAEAAARAPEEEEVAEQPRPFSGSSEWVPPEDAIASLRKPIQTWLERDSTHRKTLTVLQSAAGLGKSQTMVEEQQRAEWADRQRAKEDEGSDLAKLQRIVADLVENLHGEADPTKQYLIKTELEKQQDLFVAELLKENLANLPPPPLGKLACAVPRQKLAQEIQEVDRKRRQAEGAEGQIPILAGRNSSNCQRYELVAKAQKKGFEPSALCHQTLPSGEEVYCPFYEKCSTDPTQYLSNQAEVKEADNIIVMHSHLAIPWLPSLALSSRKRMWIDEDPCNTFVFNQSVSDDYLTELLTDCDFVLGKLEQKNAELEALEDLVETDKGKRSKERQRQNIERLAELSRNLLTGLLPPGKLQIERHLAGWTAGQLRSAGRLREAIESLRRGELDPSLNDGALSKQLDKIGAPPRKLAALFYRLADEVEARRKGEIYSLGRAPNGKITLRGRKPTNALPPNLLLTDATPSPEILRAIFPEYAQEPIKVPVRRNAFITQTSEPVFSRNWLLKEKHLPEVIDWVKRIATHYRNLVVLTTKRIRCAITGEDQEGKLEDFFEIHGARIGHYGNLRGSNKFADCDALVILGREQPNVEDMEELAEAIWYDTDKPLRLVKPVNGKSYYLKVTPPYLMRTGSKERAEVMVHPDPRVQAVLTNIRENELIQALDRARLIWSEPKDVFILCDIPLPGVEIDRLVPWNVLRGDNRLSRALVEQAAQGERALPLVPSWLSLKFHELWDTEKAAKRWLEYSPEIKDLFRMINDLQNKKPHLSNKRYLLGKWGFLPTQVLDQSRNTSEINHFALFEYRPKGQKSWSQALVWEADPHSGLAHVFGVPERELLIRRPFSDAAKRTSHDHQRIDLAAVRSRRAEQAAAREAVKADAIAKAQPQARACSRAPLEPVGLMETSEPVAPDEIRLLGEELLAEDHPASAPPTEEGAPIPPNSEIQARKPGHNSKAEAALSPAPAFATIEPLTAEGAAV